MADTTTNTQRLTAKGRATRTRILAAAADLILKHGVNGTGIEDVRKAAGVSGSQMTHYFRDKRTLVQEVIAWQAESNLASHRQPALGGLDTFDAWRLWAELITERQQGRGFVGGCEFGSLAGQLVESDDATRADLADGYQRWIALFREGLTAMRDHGDLRPDTDPQALALATLGSMQGGMLLAQTLRDVAPLREALNAAVERIESFAARPGLR